MKNVITRFILALMIISPIVVFCLNSAEAFGTKAVFVSGDFVYEHLDGQACIVSYMGNAHELVIPAQLDGYPVTAIGNAAFGERESLVNVIIPENIVNIGLGPFIFCENLLNIEVAPENQSFISVDGVLFDASQERLLAYPAGRKGAYEVPDGTIVIDYSSFQGCKELTGIIIPDSVIEIGYLAFDCCENLVSVSIPNSVTTIGDRSFQDCRSLIAITIPETVSSIGDWTFMNCLNPKLIVFEDSYAWRYMLSHGLNGITLTPSGTNNHMELASSGEYIYVLANGQATIIKYNGTDAEPVTPDQLDGFPVVAIIDNAF